MDYAVSPEKTPGHRFISAAVPDRVVMEVTEELLPKLIAEYLARDFAERYAEDIFKQLDHSKIREITIEKTIDKLASSRVKDSDELKKALDTLGDKIIASHDPITYIR